jgi:hypothetical protein
MANVKISALPAVTSVDGTEVFPLVQANTTKRAKLTQALASMALASPTPGAYSVGTGYGVCAATGVTVTPTIASVYTVPAGYTFTLRQTWWTNTTASSVLGMLYWMTAAGTATVNDRFQAHSVGANSMIIPNSALTGEWVFDEGTSIWASTGTSSLLLTLFGVLTRKPYPGLTVVPLKNIPSTDTLVYTVPAGHWARYVSTASIHSTANAGTFTMKVQPTGAPLPLTIASLALAASTSTNLTFFHYATFNPGDRVYVAATGANQNLPAAFQAVPL